MNTKQRPSVLAQISFIPEIIIAIPLILIIMIVGIANPNFFKVANIFNVLRQSSIVAITSIGVTMIIITSGTDLSTGAQMALGGVMAAMISTTWNVHYLPAFFLLLLFGAFVGSINGALVSKVHIPPFITTMGMLNVCRGATLLITGGLPVRFTSPLSSLGNGYIGPVPIATIVMVLLAVSGHIFLRKTVLGRNIYAVGNNERAAKLAGIPVQFVYFFAYMITGILAAISGTLIAGNLNSADPTAANGYELDCIAACIIGGTRVAGGEGSILGSVLGAIFMGVLRNAFVLLKVSGYWQTVAIGAVIIGAAMVDAVQTAKRNKAH